MSSGRSPSNNQKDYGIATTRATVANVSLQLFNGPNSARITNTGSTLNSGNGTVSPNKSHRSRWNNFFATSPQKQQKQQRGIPFIHRSQHDDVATVIVDDDDDDKQLYTVWTIDDSLRSLYDADNILNYVATPTNDENIDQQQQETQLWCYVDDVLYYEPLQIKGRKRLLFKGQQQQQEDTNSDPIATDDHELDENDVYSDDEDNTEYENEHVVTYNLLQELHIDPLQSIIQDIMLINTSTGSVVIEDEDMVVKDNEMPIAITQDYPRQVKGLIPTDDSNHDFEKVVTKDFEKKYSVCTIDNISSNHDNDDENNDGDDDDEFGDFQSALNSSITQEQIFESNSTSYVHQQQHETVVTLQQQHLIEPRALSFDEDENIELIQYIDSLCVENNENPISTSLTSARATPNGRNSTNATNQCSHTPSSIDTPDLVRIVDNIIHDAATTAVATIKKSDEDDESPENIIGSGTVETAITGIQQPQIFHRPLPPKIPPTELLSMQLPVSDDLATIESRFIRRLQQRLHEHNIIEQQQEEVLSPLTIGSSRYRQSRTTYPDLPDYYYNNPDFDDMIVVLQSMPWEYVFPPQTRDSKESLHAISSTISSTLSTMKNRVASSDSDDGIEDIKDWTLWDDYVTSRLCQLDTALEDIHNVTLQQLEPQKERIDHANSLIHEWDQNLRLSFMYCERSQQAIEALIGFDDDTIGLVGPLNLLEAFEQRDNYRKLQSVLDQLNDVWICENDIVSRIQRFDVTSSNAFDEYRAVMKLARDSKERVSNGKLKQLNCFGALQERLSSTGMGFWIRLLDVARSLVAHTCRDVSSFDGNQYERLLCAALDLKSQAIIEDSVNNIDFQSSWTENIINALSFEVDRAFSAALLQPTEFDISSHEMELKQFSHEIDIHYGDYSVLRGISQKLVEIRFDYEWQRNYLPRVFHRLCKHLTDIMLSHYKFVKWHYESIGCAVRGWPNSKEKLPSKNSGFDKIYAFLSSYTSNLWDHCESILAKCLDEYLNCAPKRPLFKRGTNGIDDTHWRSDLECLHNVYSLANTFLSLQKPFIELSKWSSGNEESDDESCKSLISPRLESIFRRHLRILHVEAMNTLGRSLSNESWILGSFMVSNEPELTGQQELSIEAILMRALIGAKGRSEKRYGELNEWLCELSCKYDPRSLIARLEDVDNPFDSYISSPTKRRVTNSAFAIECDVELSENAVYRTLSSLIHENDEAIRLAPDSISKELISWFARLLLIMEKLSLIAGDVSNVIVHLCDLYFATVFRLCSGNAKNERLVLGKDLPVPIHLHLDDFLSSKGVEKGSSGAQMFSSFRGTPSNAGNRKTMSRKYNVLWSCLNAEMCYPRPRHKADVEKLQTFIYRAHDNLIGAVNLDMVDSWLTDPTSDSPEELGCEVARVLTKRESSISSCYALAALVELVQKVARQNQSSLLPLEFAIDKDLASLRSYSQNVLDIMSSFVQVARQIACTRAVGGASVVKEIIKVDDGWEECKLHEFSNDYVDDLCYRCALIWGYLAASTKLPLIIMRETWDNIVSASYLSLLDGFARIPQCSTEGRALMALDLATFKASITPTSITELLDGIVPANRPPPVNPEINFFVVETYIKVFYYPKDDVFNWIKENCDQYSLNHTMGLGIAVYLSGQEVKSEEVFNDIVNRIKALYSTKDENDEIVGNKQT